MINIIITQAHLSLGNNSLTKNSNVEVLQFFSYLWVDLETIRKVNWNDANFTTILLLCGGGTHVWIGNGKGGKRRYQSTH